MKRTHGLDEREIELVKLLMADCQTTGDIQAKLKRLFAGTIEQILEEEMDEHLGYEKNSVKENNTEKDDNQRLWRYLAAASFGRVFCIYCFFRIIRVYTVLFSDPHYLYETLNPVI